MNDLKIQLSDTVIRVIDYTTGLGEDIVKSTIFTQEEVEQYLIKIIQKYFHILEEESEENKE